MSKITLGPIIGMADAEKAKIWFYGSFDEEGRTKPFCHVKYKDKPADISGSPFEFNEVSDFPYQNEGESQKAYIAEIDFPDDGDEFRFGINYAQNIEPGELKYMVKRFPDQGDIDFSFGLISCHKPRREKLGRIPAMWGLLHEKMTEKKASFLIQAGDQVYCDSDSYTINAWEKSVELLKDSQEISEQQHRQMVDFYRKVYLSGWGFPDVQNVMSTFPQYMIWDDHEIEDGWGSREEHSHGMQQGIFKAAKQAYIEFQHSHNPKPLKEGEMYYAFYYGAAAFLVLDLRGERRIKDKQLLSKTQQEEIEKWLESETVKNKKILFVVSSVPVVHVSRDLMSMAKVATLFSSDVKDDIADQWSYKHNKKYRWWLLENLMKWSQPGDKPMCILGGDVHVGTEAYMKKKGTDNCIYQVTSSPITNNRALVLDWFSAPFSSRFSFRLDENKNEYMKVRVKRRHRKRNFAVIEVKYEQGKPNLKLNMYRQGEKKPKTWQLLRRLKSKP